MKFHGSISVFIASALAVSSVVVANDFAKATSDTFVCQSNRNGTPTTFAKTSNGPREFIRWTYDGFRGYTPSRRCTEVTNRLNRYIASGSRYITYGTMSNRSVICMTNKSGAGCTDLLYTLKPGDDGREVLRDLLRLNRENFKNDPRIESPSCPVYFDINAWLAGESQTANVACTPQNNLSE